MALSHADRLAQMRKAIRAERHAAQQACLHRHAELLAQLRAAPRGERACRLPLVTPGGFVAISPAVGADAVSAIPVQLARPLVTPIAALTAAPATAPTAAPTLPEQLAWLARTARRSLAGAARWFALPFGGRAAL